MDRLTFKQGDRWSYIKGIGKYNMQSFQNCLDKLASYENLEEQDLKEKAERENKPLTNLDKIKSFTKDELKEFILNLSFNGKCNYCADINNCGELNCIAGISRYLESEVTDE